MQTQPTGTHSDSQASNPGPVAHDSPCIDVLGVWQGRKRPGQQKEDLSAHKMKGRERLPMRHVVRLNSPQQLHATLRVAASAAYGPDQRPTVAGTGPWTGAYCTDTTQLPGADACGTHSLHLICFNNNALNCSGATFNPPGCSIVTVHPRAWGAKLCTSSGDTALSFHQEGQR